MKLYEQEQLDFGEFELIAGADEAGRGPLAGPVIAAAVILDKKFLFPSLNDSKKLSEKKRIYLYDKLKETAVSYAIVAIEHDVIDKINILQASLLAMERAVENLQITPSICLVDGNIVPKSLYLPAQAIVQGDGKYASIAAASILAKVSRDRFMEELHEQFPYYNFKKNKGYPTKEHVFAIQRYGICPFHRKSFHPVAQFVLENASL
jgi:ribonuclease HII